MNKKFNTLQRNKQYPKFLVDKNCKANLSDISIPDGIQCLLSFGPNFALPFIQNQCPALNLIAEIEDIFYCYNDKSLIQEDRAILTKTINNHIKNNTPPQYINKFLIR